MYDWRIIFYSLSLIISTILCLVVAWFVWKRRNSRGAVELTLMLIEVAIWAGASFFEAVAITMEEKILWSKISYIGIVFVTPLFLIFASKLTGGGKQFTHLQTFAIFFIPITILALTFTNEFHNLIWSGFKWVPGTTILIYEHGVAFWIHTVYIYALLAISSTILLITAYRNRNIYRRQAITLLIGVPIPTIWNILYIFGFSPLIGFDLTPVAFALAGIVISWGLFRNRLLDIVPIDSDYVIDNLADGVVVLDTHNRVVEINAMAKELLRLGEKEIIGSNFFSIEPKFSRFEKPNNITYFQTYEVDLVPGEKIIEYQSQVILNKAQKIMGQVVILRDITKRKMAESALRESERRYQELVENASLPVAIIDQRTFEILYSNKRIAALLDISSRYNRGMKLDKFFSNRDELSRILLMTQKNGILNDHETSMQTQLGRTLWVLITANLTQYENRPCLFLSINDITTRKQVEESERQEKLFAEALSGSVSALNSTLNYEEVLDRILGHLEKVIPNNHANIMLVDDDGIARIVRASGYDAATLEKLLSEVNFQVSETPTLLRMAITGTPIIVSDTDIDPLWVERDSATWIKSYLGSPIHVKNKVVGYINVDSETTNAYNRIHVERLKLFANQAAIAIENARLFEKVEQMAIIDNLTGLYNRHHFFELGEREFERFKRYRHPFSILLIDLDHFKHVNDNFGHAAGDQVLSNLAQIFSKTLRKMDIPGRIGGEEFIVLLPETTMECACKVAERLRSSIESAVCKVGMASISVTASIGVAAVSDQYDSLQSVVTDADTAMYKAKARGRNLVEAVK